MIESNVKQIISEIGPVLLAAASKTRTVNEIKQAVYAGVKIIAENRVQEAELKYKQLKEFFIKNNVEFHLIGHLQTNKAKKAVEIFDLIQTLDSLKLADKISRHAFKIKKTQKVLVQINIGDEPQKYGIKKQDLFVFLEKLRQFNNIEVKGLMCIPPYNKDPRPYFREMKALFDKSNLEILSMGMSNDYRIAIEEGSNMVRIGTKIFGKRL